MTTDEAEQVVFSTNGSGSARTLAVDSTSSAFTYNPSSNVLTVGTLDIGSSNISSKSVTFNIPAGTTVTPDETAVGSCNAIEYTIFVTHSSGIQSQKVLIMDNGTTAYSQEFAVMSSSSLLLTFSADISGGNVRLRATPETGISGATTVKLTKMVIE